MSTRKAPLAAAATIALLMASVPALAVAQRGDAVEIAMMDMNMGSTASPAPQGASPVGPMQMGQPSAPMAQQPLQQAQPQMPAQGGMMMNDMMRVQGMQPQQPMQQPQMPGMQPQQPMQQAQPQMPMQGGMMMNDMTRMQGQMPGSQQSAPMQMCQNMMSMMDRMMRMQGAQAPAGGAVHSVHPDPTAQSPAVRMLGVPGEPNDRIEGRIAFMRAELKINDAQTPVWEEFANALRSSRRHLQEAREAISAKDRLSPAERLDAYERHLGARLEGLRAARTSFGTLYAGLDPGQKRTADEMIVPFIETF